MTKTRPYGTQTIVTPLVGITLFESNGTPHQFGNNRTATCTRRLGREESITTSKGVDGGFRPCTHTINEWVANGSSLTSGPLQSLKPWTGAWKINQTLVTGLQGQVHANRYATFLSSVAADLPSLSSVQWAALRAEALSTMLPSFSGDTSIANTIIELKDFKDIGNRIAQRGLSNASRIRRTQTGILHQQDPVSWSQTARRSSSLYLQYMFGWRPFINDVIELYRICKSIDERIRELVKRANSPQQRYYGRWVEGSAVNPSVLATGEDSPLGGYSGDFNPKVKWEVYRAASQGIRFHATMRYRYPVPPELTQAGGRAKALLDMLGINGNWSMLWNAIPYSFILDWFVKVSRYLNRLRVDNIPIKTEISDFCASAKIVKQYQFVLTDRNQLPNGTYVYGGKKVFDYVKASRYERKTGVPEWRSAVLLSGLSPTEFSLAGALVGSRIKPKRRTERD